MREELEMGDPPRRGRLLLHDQGATIEPIQDREEEDDDEERNFWGTSSGVGFILFLTSLYFLSKSIMVSQSPKGPFEGVYSLMLTINNLNLFCSMKAYRGKCKLL